MRTSYVASLISIVIGLAIAVPVQDAPAGIVDDDYEGIVRVEADGSLTPVASQVVSE